jgi:hypothetical protein
MYLILKEVLYSYAHLKSQSLILRSNGYCLFTFLPSLLLLQLCYFFTKTPLVLTIRSKMSD